MQNLAVGEGTAAIRLQKLQTFTSHISLQFIVISHENNWLCLRIFSSREICGKPTVQNIAGSFFKSRNSTPQHSIERGVDLHVVIESLKKMQIFYYCS